MGFMDFSITSSLFGANDPADVAEGADDVGVDKPDVPSGVPVASPSVPDDSSTEPRRLPATTEAQRSPKPSLPSSWYTSENFFALEVRAIFSQVESSGITAIANISAVMALTHTHYSLPGSRNVL
jgi:hypothetical protein